MSKTARNNWTALSAVPGDLPGLVDQIAYDEQLRVAIPYGAVRIERIGRKYEFVVYGEGGGFAWSREFSKGKTVRKLRDLTGGEVHYRRIQND